MGLFENLFSSEKRHYAKAESQQKAVLAKEQEYAAKSDEQLQECTSLFRKQLSQGTSLEDLLPDAFAAAREAAKRVIHEFPYPVQVLGGVLLFDGDIAEMKTGEGKTLTAVMPIYLCALEGKGAHIVTVNEYLADRDAKWMGDIYRFLGLTVGCNKRELTPEQKREAYLCDITYTTNAELGFDYLRDNMVLDKSQRVLRGLHVAILDEVDSILIDESRTPLIISGPGPVLDQDYLRADGFAKSCSPQKDCEISREDNSISLSASGIAKAEKYFQVANLYKPQYAGLVHYIQNALRANYLMHQDVEYVVQDNEIVLVDQFTGRKMEGREFSDGLHQAIQAKEGVGIKSETQTLATITYQNFFRLYDKLSGMTGTAKTEEKEFLDTYNMRVFEIPTNRPCIRKDEPDAVFADRNTKFDAIVEEVVRLHEKGQPVLVGTLSVGMNEALSKRLEKKGILHQVLNAKDDSREAEIIAKAGQRGAVTVATNMAGRGTDIRLGEGVEALGGLAVLGSERHEAKRIDNQLRGRSGRQGDPGFSRFYCAMDDDLMVEFASDETKSAMEAFKNGKTSEDHMRQEIDKTQLRAEGLHFDSRKNTLDFDNVLMQQRKVIYEQRDAVLDLEDVQPLLNTLLERNVEMKLAECEAVPEKEAKMKQMIEWGQRMLLSKEQVEDAMATGHPKEQLVEAIEKAYQNQMKEVEPESKKRLEKMIFLRVLDREWISHVDVMEHLKRSIYLRGYAQIKPQEAYAEEGYQRFQSMMESIAQQTISILMNTASQQESSTQE